MTNVPLKFADSGPGYRDMPFIGGGWENGCGSLAMREKRWGAGSAGGQLFPAGEVYALS